MQGFLGWGGTLEADVNLLMQLALGAMVIFGFVLARRQKFQWHAANQSFAVLANITLVALVMFPSFYREVLPSIKNAGHDRSILFGLAHSIVGTIALGLALWVVLSAKTRLLPEKMRMQRWKIWMRLTLTLWLVALAGGVATYFEWYKTGPARVAALAPSQVRMTNFEFIPKTITIRVGGSVTWINEGGRHTVQADDKSFESANLVKGQSFTRTFEKAGTYPYYCANHGATGGKAMSGSVVVAP